MTSYKKTLLAEANVSAKRNLTSVGDCADTPVDVDAAGNADGKRPCLDIGQTVLMRTPTQAEFVDTQYEIFVEAVGQGRRSWCFDPRNAQASSSNLDSKIC